MYNSKSFHRLVPRREGGRGGVSCPVPEESCYNSTCVLSGVCFPPAQ